MNENFNAPPLLEIHNATLLKDGNRILDILNLRVEAGQHTAILGANGSGKSSLIKLITRQEYPLAQPKNAPPVKIWGRARWDVTQLRALLGIVSADVRALFAREGEISAREAVLSGFFGSRGLSRHHQTQPWMFDATDAALSSMDATSLSQRTLSTLSTGEMQRVLVARALVADPPALLLDEPTTGLDMVARRQFLQTLRRIIHNGKTLILVTHHVEEILPEIERVVLLRAGKIVADGCKSQALTSPSLSYAFDAPIQVERHGEFYAAGVKN